MAEAYTHQYLTPWKPTPTDIPSEWQPLIDKHLHEVAGTANYSETVSYKVQDVGDLLCSWGLDWEVVVAGYLLYCEEERLLELRCRGTAQVLTHRREALSYIDHIEDEKLLIILTPPYNDLGALLIAVTVHYLILKNYLQQNDPLSYAEETLLHIEKIGMTLLNIVKRLGMWLLKREIEDVVQQICHPLEFSQDKKEFDHILQRDSKQLQELSAVLTAYFCNLLSAPVTVTYSLCGIAGLGRRRQDAHTTSTSHKKHLTGFDIATFDITTSTVRDCYNIYGMLSQLGYLQDRLTDQIANPKPNGNSNLALGLVLKPQNSPLQVVNWLTNEDYTCQFQIATHIMQAVTNYGCLYPTCYQLYTNPSLSVEVLPTQQFWGSEEGKIFSTIKDFFIMNYAFASEKAPIVVFDKKRNPVRLPKGATVLDFAYASDEQMAERAVDGIINNRKAPLNRILDSGDIVEIRAAQEAQVQSYWIDHGYVTTQRAIEAITKKKEFLGNQKLDVLQQMLHFHKYMLEQDELLQELDLLLREYHLGPFQEYLENLAKDAHDLQHTPEWVIDKIIQQMSERLNRVAFASNWEPVLDKHFASERFVHWHLCGSCKPKHPNDVHIFGRIRKREQEIVVHKINCAHLNRRLEEYNSVALPMKWQKSPPRFRVGFFATTPDRDGLIAALTKELLQHNCSLVFIQGAVFNNIEAQIRFTIEASNDNEVLTIWQKLAKIEGLQKLELNAAVTPQIVVSRLKKLSPFATSGGEHNGAITNWQASFTQHKPRPTILENPFNIARPASLHRFVGRTEEMKTMQRILCEGDQSKAVILSGPLRSGKSSLCKNFLERCIHAPMWQIYYSLPEQTREEEIFGRLAEKICTEMNAQLNVSPPLWEQLWDLDPRMRFRRLLRECFELCPHSRLVLALDEFGSPLASYRKGLFDFRFFPYWKELVNEIPQLSLILVLPTNAYMRLNSDEFANLFSFAEPLTVHFLDQHNAEHLLTLPFQRQNIDMPLNVVDQVLKLTGYNPYYLTLIGSHFMEQLNQEPQKQQITQQNLQTVIDYILITADSSQNFNFYLREVQNLQELDILEGIVKLMPTHSQPVSLKKLAHTLNSPHRKVFPYLKRLRNGLILEEYDSHSTNPHYTFKIELAQRWMAQNPWFFDASLETF